MTATNRIAAVLDGSRVEIDPTKHIGLAKTAAFRFAARCPWMDRDEVYGVAMLGLVRAARSFDPSLSSKFTTHAIWTIRADLSAMLDKDLRAQGHVRATHGKKRYRRVASVSSLESMTDRGWDPETSAEEVPDRQGDAEFAWRFLTARLKHRHAAVLLCTDVLGMTPEKASPVLDMRPDVIRRNQAVARTELRRMIRMEQRGQRNVQEPYAVAFKV